MALGLVVGQVGLGFQGLEFQGRVGSWSSWFRVLGIRILGQDWQLIKLVQGFRVQDFRVGLVVGQVGLGFQGLEFQGKVGRWSSSHFLLSIPMLSENVCDFSLEYYLGHILLTLMQLRRGFCSSDFGLSVMILGENKG